MTQRQSLLRYTKSVHKLCMEHGKDDDSDSEGNQSLQGVRVLDRSTSSGPARGPSGAPGARAPAAAGPGDRAPVAKSSSARMPLENLFTQPQNPSSRAPPITASLSMFPLSLSNSKSPPTSPTNAASNDPKKQSGGSRRPLNRESASFNLSVRQIKQEGVPKEQAQRPTLGRKDTITVYDWFKAMDEEAEKEKTLRGTLRAQGITRSKTLKPQPTKAPSRVNSNFEFFMKQAQDGDPKGAAAAPPPELPKSKSLNRVESKWGIFDAPTKGSVRFFDGGTKKKKENSAMGKQIAEDDASLKVFMQAWNMLDTFEEHLAVHIELDKAEEERQQMAKEQPSPKTPFDPTTQLIDVSFNTNPAALFPLDSPSISAKKDMLPPDLVLLLTPDVVVPPESPIISPMALPSTLIPEEPLTPATEATPSTPTPSIPSIPIPHEIPTTTPEPTKPVEVATPTTESPRAEPVAESPRPTEPVAESPRPTEPVAESPRPTEPVAESPRPTEPTTESPRPTEPAIESPRPPEPAIESPRPTEPVAESPRPTEPVAESPRPTEPAVESPRPTEPVAESPRTTEPVAESPRATEPAVESPRVATEPAAVSPRPTEPAEPTVVSPRTEPTEPAPAHESSLKQELLAALTTTTAPTPSVADFEVKPPPVHVDVPEGYEGPHYSNPITEEFLEHLFQYCATEGTSSLVPRGYVDHIIRDSMALFKSEPTIVDIPLDGKVIVVGDIHGQFPDLITILRDTGLPGKDKQVIVFNGDFVDRGPAGVEVLLCLYAMKLHYPKNVYIHRGNHELESINRKYNFCEQVVSKYDNELFLLIQDSFAFLPLGCVIGKKVLVIHGGLPEDPISLGQIRALPKLREDPTKAHSGPEKIVQSILWSDPRDRRGARPSKRGAGVEFGPDITASFLARNDLDLLVRSHEMVEEGYQLSHNGNVMTIFSASYYCGVSTNKGAFAVFAPGTDMKKPTIVQYYAQAYSSRDNVLKSCVKETLEKLREMIFINRHRLCLYFSSRDAKNSGKITKADWCEGMSAVMGLHIGWNGMLPYLAKVEGDKINYSKFLDRYKITRDDMDDDDDDDDNDELNAEKKAAEKAEKVNKAWQKETMGYMCANIHSTVAQTLPDAFAKFDKDKDGKLCYKEFMDMIDSLQMDLSPPDDNQFYDLMRRMDEDEDGMVSLKDWEEALGNAMERAHTLYKEEWIPPALIMMRAAIDKNFDFITNTKSRLKSAFRKCRQEGGRVQRRGFTDWIERALEIESFTSVQKLRIAMYVDFNGNGKISWREFKKVFSTPEYYDTIQSNLFKPGASK